LARCARQDAERLTFWAASCQIAMASVGDDDTMCRPLVRAVERLNALADCAESPECVDAGAAVRRLRRDRPPQPRSR
jgi:hypothetical protein